MPEPETQRTGPVRMSAPLRYRIRPMDPAAHLFEVSLIVQEPDSSGQVFAIYLQLAADSDEATAARRSDWLQAE